MSEKKTDCTQKEELVSNMNKSSRSLQAWMIP